MVAKEAAAPATAGTGTTGGTTAAASPSAASGCTTRPCVNPVATAFSAYRRGVNDEQHLAALTCLDGPSCVPCTRQATLYITLASHRTARNGVPPIYPPPPSRILAAHPSLRHTLASFNFRCLAPIGMLHSSKTRAGKGGGNGKDAGLPTEAHAEACLSTQPVEDDTVQQAARGGGVQATEAAVFAAAPGRGMPAVAAEPSAGQGWGEQARLGGECIRRACRACLRSDKHRLCLW